MSLGFKTQKTPVWPALIALLRKLIEEKLNLPGVFLEMAVTMQSRQK